MTVTCQHCRAKAPASRTMCPACRRRLRSAEAPSAAKKTVKTAGAKKTVKVAEKPRAKKVVKPIPRKITRPAARTAKPAAVAARIPVAQVPAAAAPARPTATVAAEARRRFAIPTVLSGLLRRPAIAAPVIVDERIVRMQRRVNELASQLRSGAITFEQWRSQMAEFSQRSER